MVRRALVVGVCAVVVAAGLSALAWAVMSSTRTAALDVSTATLRPPTGVSVTANCAAKPRGVLTVSWTPSSSAFVGGYVVSRTGGAAFTPVTLPATATSYADSNVAGSTTYTYTVVATYLGWTSTIASAPPVTTAKKC